MGIDEYNDYLHPTIPFSCLDAESSLSSSSEPLSKLSTSNIDLVIDKWERLTQFLRNQDAIGTRMPAIVHAL